MNLVWLPTALDEREAQLDHVAADNPAAADTLADEIAHHVAMLADHPEMGRAGRVKGTRELPLARTPFIAVYRVRPHLERVEILRLLHGRQQWPASE